MNKQQQQNNKFSPVYNKTKEILRVETQINWMRALPSKTIKEGTQVIVINLRQERIRIHQPNILLRLI